MQTNDFKTQMEAMREDLATAIAAGADAVKTVELDQTTQGRLSRMDAMQQQQMALATRARNQHRLRLIDAALKRIETDDFGYCAQCGEAIAENRLKLDPTIQTCIECAV